jgi:hypothetical protein
MADKKTKYVITCRKQCWLHNKDGENVIVNRGDLVELSDGEFSIHAGQGRAATEDSPEGKEALADAKKTPMEKQANTSQGK